MSSPDRRAQRRESTHRAIAAAALQLIVEQDAEGLSVAELARRAGVSRRTVFNHYSSIEEAAVAQTLRELDELSETIPLPQIPVDAALPVVVARLVEAFVASPASLELILRPS
ncbi:TetR/AcrR family transcriptional regulator, partial [Rothia kristinae]|uniref:TetR/AcrR family transcriptional regulator n=1 Tax=Rothia kristinae TaxID=37923 RepID=UPI000799FD04